MSAEISNRARKILEAVVQEYLRTGEAVGSRTVTKRKGIALSPATVRNVMSDLEDLGLLAQPHTSAGRVPTGEGMRFFIDSLLKVRTLSEQEKQQLRSQFGVHTSDVDEALVHTSKVLSELSEQASVLIMPNPDRYRIHQIQFVRLRDDAVLAVLVSDEGNIQNRLLQLDSPLQADFLQRASNYLSELAKGFTLEELRQKVLEELGVEKNRVDELAAQALRLAEQTVATGSSAPAVIVSGQANLLEQGAESMERARALLTALEEKERFAGLLDQTLQADGIRVWLGADTPLGELGDVSVVATPYGPEDKRVGTIAVIGPTRMNYSKVIPLVDFTATLVGDILKKI